MADLISGESAQVTPFNFNAHAVRVIMRDGEPWFVAKDVCEALGYANSRDAVADHLDEDEKGVANGDTLGGAQKLIVINESGLYALVLRSRKPEARKFAKWVTGEVLPSIRKTGVYQAPEKTVDVRGLLLTGQSELQVSLPRGVAAALEKKALEMAHEAYLISREHLRRRVAHRAVSSAGVLKEDAAFWEIESCDLGRALVMLHEDKCSHMESVVRLYVEMAKKAGKELGLKDL